MRSRKRRAPEAIPGPKVRTVTTTSTTGSVPQPADTVMIDLAARRRTLPAGPAVCPPWCEWCWQGGWLPGWALESRWPA